MSYLESLVAGIASTVVAAGLFVGAGLLDRRGGYHTFWNPLSVAMFLVGCVALSYVLWLLMPYIIMIVVACVVGGTLLALAGLIKIALT